MMNYKGTKLLDDVIVALTAIDDNETVQKVLEMKARDYLIKSAGSSGTFRTIINHITTFR